MHSSYGSSRGVSTVCASCNPCGFPTSSLSPLTTSFSLLPSGLLHKDLIQFPSESPWCVSCAALSCPACPAQGQPGAITERRQPHCAPANCSPCETSRYWRSPRGDVPSHSPQRVTGARGLGDTWASAAALTRLLPRLLGGGAPVLLRSGCWQKHAAGHHHLRCCHLQTGRWGQREKKSTGKYF